jgi:hypothetical protein
MTEVQDDPEQVKQRAEHVSGFWPELGIVADRNNVVDQIQEKVFQ